MGKTPEVETLLCLVVNKQYDKAARVILSSSQQEIEAFLEKLTYTDKGADSLKEILTYMEIGQFKEAIQCMQRLPSGKYPEQLLSLACHLQELYTYETEIASGNLRVPMPKKQNYLAMGAKNLHSKLNHLVWQIRQVADGDYGQSIDHMGDLSDSFNWMIGQLQYRYEQETYEKTHDSMTGLLNRSEFMHQVNKLLKAQPDSYGVLLYCGLDNLKSVNETYGHENGDRYIMAAAEVFRMFASTGNIAGRITGDEFALYLHGFDEQPNLMALEKNINNKMKQSFDFYDAVIKIRMSVGISLYPQDARGAQDLFTYASYTMFQVKHKNRGTIMRFNSELYRNKANSFDRLEKLSRLLDERLLRFAFQPIVNLHDMKVIGYEALMRPTISDFSSPLDLLAIAEEQSKLYQLEMVTYELVFDLIYRNLEELNGKRIFFNTISTNFLEDQELKKIHPEYREICPYLAIEVLESTVDVEKYVYEIDSFRDRHGSLVALDDYGSGYSNDLRLISIKPDIVKIDRLFINGIEDDLDKQNVLLRIIAYCKEKGIHTLAEGIETESQLQKVISMGFTYGQGYYLGRPEFIF